MTALTRVTFQNNMMVHLRTALLCTQFVSSIVKDNVARPLGVYRPKLFSF